MININIDAEIKQLLQFIEELNSPVNDTIKLRKAIASIGNKLATGLGDKIDEMPVLEVKEIIHEWAARYLPTIDEIVVGGLKRLSTVDRNFELTIATWSGTQGTGKGTNIDSMKFASEIFAELYRVKNKHIPESILPFINAHTGAYADIVVGTGGMTNMPQGEYKLMFDDAYKVTSSMSKRGEFVSDSYINLFSELMLLLRVAEGARKVLIDVWPRSFGQFEHYNMLFNYFHVENLNVKSEIVNLRLLTPHELIHLAGNVPAYIELSPKIALRHKELLKEEWVLQAVMQIKSMDPDTELREMYAIMEKIVEKITVQMKNEFNFDLEPTATNILTECDRALGRMKERFEKALKNGEKPRVDELPHAQLNRIVQSELDTSSLKASLTQDVDFISSYQPPEKVVQDIMDVLIAKVDNAKFMYDHPELWAAFKEVAGEVAKAIVAKKSIEREVLMGRLVKYVN